MTESRIPAALVLGDGHVYRGYAFGAVEPDSDIDPVYGEAVFTTGMTGYQETMTDPSYHRQIVVMTAPQIGNTGWNDEDNESRDGRIWVAGLIVRDLSKRVSNWRAERSLEEEMRAQGIVGISGIDTRSVVRHLRNEGSAPAGLFVGEASQSDVQDLVAKVNEQPTMAGADLSAQVSTDSPYTIEAVGEKRYTVVAYDMGIKTATPNHLAQRGVETIVVPANTAYEDILQYKPDGVFISNGPGDPATADEMVAITRKIIQEKLPLFGICFGNQILGRALAAPEGIGAGETFDTEFGPAVITHTCLNDDVVEGVALENGMAYSVQFHPESAAGPHDANPLFDQFIALMDEHSPNAK